MRMLCFVFCCCLLTAANGQEEYSLYVSPQGRDTYSGTKERPFATLERAKRAVRARLQQGHTGGIYVFLREGRYTLTSSFRLDSLDAGTEDAPVVYSAYAGEQVSVNGSVSVPVQKAVKIRDGNILRRLEPAAREKIYQINLKALRINNFGQLRPRGFSRPYEPAAMELFCNQSAMRLSRWPNDSLVRIGKVLDPGSIPRNGDYSERGGKFSFETDRPLRWTQAKDFWISGFFRYGFADDAVGVAELDPVNRTIATAQPHMYGFEGGKVFQTWYAFNLLEEIDQPGEYYIDRDKGMLYFFPPEEPLTEITLSVLETPLVTMTNVSHTSFRNIIFEEARGIGVYIEGGTSNTIENCVFRNLGLVGVMLGQGIQPFSQLRHAGSGIPASGLIGSLYVHIYDNTTMNRHAGTHHLITGCHIYNTGSGGIILGGGDRLTLEKGNNRVENCRIHDFNRLERSYRSGINVDGVGSIIRNNEIYNCPGSAILLHGNDHLIEKNEIHHAVTDGDDMGAIYYGRDPSESGNKVIHNFFHHIGNDHGMIMAVYHDDGACDMEVTGNIFYKAGSPTVMIGGGNDNVYRNNIFIDVPMAFQLDNRLQHWAAGLVKEGGLFKKRLEAVNYRRPPYATAYPRLRDYFSDTAGLPKRNYIEHNVFVNIPILHNGKAAWSYIGRNYFTSDKTIFTDFDAMDFTLREDAELFRLLPGFKAIPFDQIGLKK